MREAIVRFILVLLVIVLVLVLIILADGWVQSKVAAKGGVILPSLVGHTATAMLPMSPLFAAVWIWWQNKRRIAKYAVEQGE